MKLILSRKQQNLYTEHIAYFWYAHVFVFLVTSDVTHPKSGVTAMVIFMKEFEQQNAADTRNLLLGEIVFSSNEFRFCQFLLPECLKTKHDWYQLIYLENLIGTMMECQLNKKHHLSISKNQHQVIGSFIKCHDGVL